MRIPTLVLAVAMSAALPAGLIAQTPPSPATPVPTPSTSAVEGIFRLGAAAADTTGSLNRVGEYLQLRDTASSAMEFWGDRNGVRFDVSAVNGGTSRDQDYRADLDIRRLVKAHVRYQRFGHRLDHDPLTYMDASSGLGGTFVALSTDTDPGATYSQAVGALEARVDVTLPTRVPVTFFLGHNRQTRNGAHQVMTIAHCATCHTYAFTRRVNELTRELIAGAMIQAKRLTVEYGYEDSTFRDSAPDIRTQYDNAVHPQSLIDMFLNRVQYDDANGLLPVATTPGVSKQLHRVRARLDLPGDAALVGTFTQSTQENDDTGLQVDYTGVSGRLVIPFRERFTFKADLKRYDIDADDVFVHVTETVSPAGLTAGLTYEQAYPTVGELDFVRESDASRTPTELTLELGMQPARRTFLRAGYTWQETKRESFDIHKTTTNTFYVTGHGRAGRRASLRFRFQQDFTTDPFMYENAAIPAVLQPFASPGTPASPLTGLQYFQMYASRQGNLTSLPTQATRLDGSITLTPTERLALTVHYNYRRAQNDELNYSDWGRTAHTPGVDLFLSPGDRWTLSAGYVRQKERLETLFSTLAFAG